LIKNTVLISYSQILSK